MSAPSAATVAPVVSVIVPVRDDARGCSALVERLAAQSLPPGRFEVVIGDDGAPPGSLDGLATPDDRVRIIKGAPQSSYAARNRAASEARGEVLAFVDSDCLPDAAWLEEGLAALAHADLVAGEVAFVCLRRPTVWTLLTIDLFMDQARNVRRARAVTANLFVRRVDFVRWRGFDGSLVSGGDFEFAARAVASGARLAYASRAVVRHPTTDGARAFFAKVWRTNRWSAIRRRQEGLPLTLSTMLGCLPIAGGAFVRRQTLRRLAALDRGRLDAAGLDVSRWEEWRALAMLYLVVGQVANAARLSGWLEGRRTVRVPGHDGPAPRSGSSAIVP
jgi:glycosyltransferase involved in cell wall biosynthesis